MTRSDGIGSISFFYFWSIIVIWPRGAKVYVALHRGIVVPTDSFDTVIEMHTSRFKPSTKVDATRNLRRIASRYVMSQDAGKTA